MTPLLPAVLAALAVAAAIRPPTLLRPGSRAAPGNRPRPTWALPAVAALSAGCGVAVLVGGTSGLVAGLIASVAGWRGVQRLETPAARCRRERLEAGLPHAVDLLSACLAAGQAPGPAVEQVAAAADGPLREELTAVITRLELGADPVTVWREVADHPQLGRLGRCVARAVDSGASVAEAMTRLAEDLRRDARARVEGRARAVGVKAALPLGLCMLPAFVLVGVVPLVAGSMSALLAP
ncbi:MAG: type II secretion system F family protein [Nocardioides sp.]